MLLSQSNSKRGITALIDTTIDLQDLSKLSIAELKEKLRSHGLPLKGKKADLLSRLTQATSPTQPEPAQPDKPVATAHVASPVQATRQDSGEVSEAVVTAAGDHATQALVQSASVLASGGEEAVAGSQEAAPQPGTRQLDDVASAKVCMPDKLLVRVHA